MKAYAGRILMLLKNTFPIDPRVRNEAHVLTEAGYKVSILALSSKGDKAKEDLNGVAVYRVPRVNLFTKSTSSKSRIHILLYRISSTVGYIFEYCYFTLACLLLSPYIAIREGFDVVHAHNPPNSLFLVGLLYRLFGKKFVFDHHDLAPELYLSRYGIEDGFIYRTLIMEEKACLKSADMVIATNESYKALDIKRGKIKPEKVFVVRNGPDLNTMQPVAPHEELEKMGKSILLYVGKIGPQDGVDYLLRALRYIVYEIGRTDVYCVIIGPGHSLEDVKLLAHELKLEDFVRFTGFVPQADLPRYLSTADICIEPNPSSPLNDLSTCIKVMEYMALGKPIVSFDLKETRYSAQGAAIYVTPNDEKEFAKAVLTLMDDPVERAKMGACGYRRIREELSWQRTSSNLLLAYESLKLR
jgi:glycosyltransferase involved in cell wall biosynthesis